MRSGSSASCFTPNPWETLIWEGLPAASCHSWFRIYREVHQLYLGITQHVLLFFSLSLHSCPIWGIKKILPSLSLSPPLLLPPLICSVFCTHLCLSDALAISSHSHHLRPLLQLFSAGLWFLLLFFFLLMVLFL